jgi:hypothetical protein
LSSVFVSIELWWFVAAVAREKNQRFKKELSKNTTIFCSCQQELFVFFKKVKKGAPTTQS